MSVTSAPTLQMRRSIATGELRADLRWNLSEERGDPSRTLETLVGRLSSTRATSLIAEKSPVWLIESGPGGGEEVLLPTRSFPRRARRLAKVGGLSSLSDISPESSIVTQDFRANGGGGQSPREGRSMARRQE